MNTHTVSQVSHSGMGQSDRDQRLELVIAEYLENVRAGRPADRAGILARHPGFAADLATFFADEDRLLGLAGSMLAGQSHGGEGLSGQAHEKASDDRQL